MRIESYFLRRAEIAETKERLEASIAALDKEKEAFDAQLQLHYDKLEKEHLSDSVDEMEIVDLNVGGTLFISTSMGTLTKHENSLLSLFFRSSVVPKVDNRIFLDRNGDVFALVINYLRTGKYPAFLTKKERQLFLAELDYWQIPTSDS